MAHFNNTEAVLSAEQFEQLKELLRPGHELATLMLADYKAQRAVEDCRNGIAAETRPNSDLSGLTSDRHADAAQSGETSSKPEDRQVQAIADRNVLLS